MTPKRAFVDYLRDILDAANKAEQFTHGMDLAQFMADEKTQFAIIRALEIVGEAAKNVPSHIHKRYPEISLAGDGGDSKRTDRPGRVHLG